MTRKTTKPKVHHLLNWYLVVVRTTMDELPIALLSDRREAKRKAMSVTDAEMDRACRIMQIDCCGRINVAIIRFRNGVPMRMEIVRELAE